MIHKTKKSLGQNFLKSIPALNKIIEVGEISNNDLILEIGPGKGILTEKLLSAISAPHKEADNGKANKVIAIEKDRALFEFLKTKFEKEIKEKKLILLNEDILKIEVKKIWRDFVFKSIGEALEPSIAIHQQANMCGFKNKISPNFSYKIIANIPYNITGAILKKFLTEECQPERMVLMVQHEVARRIVANNEPESILSISVKAYGNPKMVMKVPARYFSPAPRVDSAIISIKNISREVFIKNNINEKDFWEIIHTGFAHKRKKLSSNLKKYKNEQTKNLINSFENKRAEELSLENWIELVRIVDINKKE